MTKLKKAIIAFCLICFALTFAGHFFEMPIISFLIVGLLALGAYKFNPPKFGVILFTVAFLLRILVVVFIEPPIISDYAVIYDTAREILNGNLNAASSQYMLTWGYQMGYTLFITMLLAIIDNVLFVKIINCLFTALIVLFIYLIVKELTNPKVARVLSVIYMVFPFPLLFNTILSNMHIASFMFLLAIYILISQKTKDMNRILKFILIGGCLAVGNIIRPEAIVFNFAILIYLFLTAKKGQFKNAIVSFLIMFITYSVFTYSASFVAMKSGVSPSGFENKAPLWKFAVGFNLETKGSYNDKLAKEFFEVDEQRQKEITYENVFGSLYQVPALFLHKAQNFWLGSDLHWVTDYMEDKNLNLSGIKIPLNIFTTIWDSLNKLIIYLIFILTFISIVVKRHKIDNRQLLILLVLLTYFGVYILIECTPKYAYTAHIFLFLMSSYALEYILPKLQALKNTKLKPKYAKDDIADFQDK